MAYIGGRRQGRHAWRTGDGWQAVVMRDPEEPPDVDPREPTRPGAEQPASLPEVESEVAGLSPSAGVRVLRAVRVPGVVLLLGILLSVVGPLPGLGAFLVIGAALVTFVMGMTALVGR
jgi:hypothetical protein